MASVTFTVSAAGTSITAHFAGCTVGHTYLCEVGGFGDNSGVATGTTLDVTVSGITYGSATANVVCWDDTTGAVIGSTVIEDGSDSQFPFAASLSYDGANSVSLTFFAVSGNTYELDLFDNADSESGTPLVGDDAFHTVTTTKTGAPFGGRFVGEFYFGSTDLVVWTFDFGVAGGGIPGNPLITIASVGVTLDGVDVTQFCVQGSWTRRLNRPSTAQVRCNMEVVNASVGSLLKIEALVGGVWTIVHHGRVLLCETDTAEDGGYTVYNSTDPMELWQWRPVRADDGDFTKPAGSLETNGNDLFATYRTGPLIIEAMLKNTEGDSTAQGNPGLTPPTTAEGPTFLDFGSFATGGVDLSGAPVDWPMTIAELSSLLISTGECDVVITPTDPGGGIMGTVDGYNGRYGTDLSASIIFSYGMGDFNIRRLRWNEDMTSVMNKLWYYGGPRITTAADPAGDQHWCWNITGDDTAFNPDGVPAGAWTLGGSYVIPDTVTNLTPSVTFICILGHVATAADEPGVGANWQTYWTQSFVAPGGRNSPPASSTNNPLGVKRIASQGLYGVRMDIQIFDAYDGDCVPGFGTPGRNLYRKRWQTESWIRSDPRELIHITPTRETEIGTFDVGDIVGVEAVSAVRGGFSGAQRVYEYTVSWDQDGVLELSELQTSADNEGL